MNNIKMIVLDLDGTLLHGDKTISDMTIAALQKCRAANIIVAIATARFWIAAEKFIDILQPDYEITADGAIIHHGDEVLWEAAFDKKTADNIIRKAHSINPAFEIITGIGKTVYWNRSNIPKEHRLYKAVYCDYSDPFDKCANKFVINFHDRNIAESFSKEYDCNMISYRDADFYSLIPKNAGKLEAVMALSESLRIPLKEIAAFGDDENDIAMLRACGTGIAMGNAIDEVKAVADHVCASNEDDGVAEWLEKYLL